MDQVQSRWLFMLSSGISVYKLKFQSAAQLFSCFLQRAERSQLLLYCSESGSHPSPFSWFLFSSSPHKKLFLLLDQNVSGLEFNATVLTTLGFCSIPNLESITLFSSVATSGIYLFCFIIFVLYWWM